MTAATAAYRKDLAANGRPFGERDGDWIMVGSLVERASGMSHHEAQSILAQAAAYAASAMDEKATRLAQREWGTTATGLEPITLLSIAEFTAGARHTSAALVDALIVHLRLTPNMALGRALAQRARSAYQFGEHELAEDLYGQVAKLGGTLASAELKARATAGYTALKHAAGNLPEYRAQAAKFLALAKESGIPFLIRNAHYSGLISAAHFKDFDDALRHGWEVYRLSAGNSDDEASALQSLGQLFLEMGDHVSARAAHAAVTRHAAPANVMLPALGGLAVAAAATGETSLANWAIAEIETFRDKVVIPHAMATALIDAAIAHRDLKRVGEARRCRDEAIALASRHRYHQLLYRAETLGLDEAPAATPARVDRTSDEIIRSVRMLEPRRLPRHVLVAAGS